MKVPYTIRRFAVMFMLIAVGAIIVFPLSEILFAEGVFHRSLSQHLLAPLAVALIRSAAMTYFEAKESKR